MSELRCALQAKDELAQAIMNAIRNHTGRQQHSGLEKAMIQLVSARHTPACLQASAPDQKSQACSMEWCMACLALHFRGI